ncbi:MAG: hypothetical protein H0U84_09615 [Thermoleophilaceae bacterium]|nr:hypothetical protein [Thermoleophilaceae bacterium]
MALTDVAGIFSRFFIVGFFLPSFFALVTLSQLLTDDFLPDGFEAYSGATEILILGGVALLLGLFLLGLDYPILRLYEGYPLQRGGLGLDRPFIWLQHRTYKKLADAKARAHQGGDPAANKRGIEAWQTLDRFFPDKPSRLLPTRFGNALRAWEDYSYTRWGLDSIRFWAHVEPLLSEQERQLHENAQTDVAFFINSSLAAAVVGVVLIADAIANGPVGWAWAWLYVVPFLVAYLIYRFAIDAGRRWGVEVRASLDLHRLEVYDKLGVRRPTSFTDERTAIAPALNRFFLYATHMPDDLWAEQPEGGEQ